MFAIRNKETGEWVYGTNFGYGFSSQRTSQSQALTFSDVFRAESEFQYRGCNEDYEIVKVELRKIDT